ncbi:NAD synthetase [Veronia nyctiphanis]|uniref:NAD synthetase n=1 Tax=Veronia nyctiphanis TaxID=1278244 RepID=A0A4Q0YVI5_9GAMM|nr:ABC transporter permease [Veronia nyctiphanis]RXJ74234.1 NAD synthetase [Veronia nyctiphanis]
MTTITSASAATEQPKSKKALTPRQLMFNRLLQHKVGVAGGIFILFLLIICVSAPLFSSFLGNDAFEVSFFSRYEPAGAEFWLGADELGRDVFLRLLYAGQISLGFAVVTALFMSIIGTTIGICAGYFGGKTDSVLMRFADFVLSLPGLPVLIVLSAIDPEKLGVPADIARSDFFAVAKLTIIFCILGWPQTARLVRAGTLSVREREYVKAAVGYGASSVTIIFRHVLPNVISPVIVATTMGVGGVILGEAALSFLGMGIQPPTPSWGNMLNNAKETIWQAPGLAIYPGIAITMTVMAINFFGDALQDAIDPKSQ